MWDMGGGVGGWWEDIYLYYFALVGGTVGVSFTVGWLFSRFNRGALQYHEFCFLV